MNDRLKFEKCGCSQRMQCCCKCFVMINIKKWTLRRFVHVDRMSEERVYVEYIMF